MTPSMAGARKVITLSLCAAVLALGGCRHPMLYFENPQGPPEYQLGWQDGCDSAIAADGNFVQKLRFGFHKRPEFNNSAMYKQGWNEGFMYCRFYTGSVNR